MLLTVLGEVGFLAVSNRWCNIRQSARLSMRSILRHLSGDLSYLKDQVDTQQAVVTSGGIIDSYIV